MKKTYTIVLVLRSGGDFSINDARLIAYHLRKHWKEQQPLRIILLWDKAKSSYNLGAFEVKPLTSTQPGTWSRIELYSPELADLRPFLYLDLDTAVLGSVKTIFDAVKNEQDFITLEDFWRKKMPATGVAWIPNNDKVNKIYEGFRGPTGKRMDAYIQSTVSPDAFWQDLTKAIHDFKPRKGVLLEKVPEGAILVCFHGKPRIQEAQVSWVKQYVEEMFKEEENPLVTVIIPYNIDRGWLKEAITSVPDGVQLIVSQGEGNWPENFNKALPQAKGKYIRWLHEDDRLTPNSIDDSVRAIESQDVDFIHGNALEFWEGETKTKLFIPKVKIPTVQNIIMKNPIHSATILYKREVFDKVGLMDETLNSAEEFEFNLRCLQKGMRIGYCDAVLAEYRRHPFQKVRTVNAIQRRKERNQVRAQFSKR
jgi:hypothetical protein